MADAALEILTNIIDLSNMLLKLLDNSKLEFDSSQNDLAKQESDADIKNVLAVMAVREEKIHHIFNSFSHEQLLSYKEELQLVARLDLQVVNKVNISHTSAKSKILTLKKNKKAINTYQKL